MRSATLAIGILLATTAFSSAVWAAANTIPDLVPSGYTAAATDLFATKIVGSKVYTGTAADAAEIGYVKDLILGTDGKITAVILGIGGFLGAGEKNVVVGYPQIQWTVGSDGAARGSLASTKEQLAAAPDFKFPDYAAIAQASGASVDAAGISSTAPQPGDTDVSKLQPLDLATLKSEDLKGIDVISPTGQKLGDTDDFVLSADGKVDAVIVEFGGFLGLGKKEVAVAYPGKFLVGPNNERYLMLNVTKEQLDAQAAYNKDDYAKNRDVERLVVAP
jgi:sporulation protein YlmC with PRC-barrel domain